MSASFRHPRLLLALALLMATPATRAADVTTFDELLRLVRSEPDPATVLEKCGDTIFTLNADQRTQLTEAARRPR